MASAVAGRPTEPSNARHARGLRIGAVVVAGVLQAVVLVPFTIASGLLAPLWAVLALYGAWAVGVWALVLTARRRPLATPLVPVASAFVVWVVITAGEAWLGWTG